MTANYLSGARRGLGMSIYTLGGNLGFALGPIFAAFVVLRWGAGSTIWLLAFGLPISLILYLSRGAIAISPPSRTGTSKPGKIRWAQMPWVELGALTLVVALRSWAYQGFIVYLPLLLQSKGIDLSAGSRLLFVFLIAGAIAGLVGGHLSDLVGRKKVIAGSLLLFSPSCSWRFEFLVFGFRFSWRSRGPCSWQDFPLSSSLPRK